jgi:hypothetical protein
VVALPLDGSRASAAGSSSLGFKFQHARRARRANPENVNVARLHCASRLSTAPTAIASRQGLRDQSQRSDLGMAVSNIFNNV